MRKLGLLLTVIFGALACGPSTHFTGDGGGTGTGADAPQAIDGPTSTDAPQNPVTDASVVDVINPYHDADIATGDGGCASTACPSPVPDGCGAMEMCDDGLDNNCDGQVDEGCSCTPGSVQACFHGPPGRRHVGACVDGMQTCQGATEFGNWGPCTGGISPTTEVCDSQDNNCNGCVDDNPLCCVVDLMCPGPGDMPDGAPFVDYTIDGTAFYSGTVTAWSWTVQGGPCDQLLESTSGTTSYTLSGTTTSHLTIHPTLSGDYTVTVVMTLPDGTTQSCTFIVHIGGPGMRVELCWDTTGSSDVDLHVHRSGTTTPWFTTMTSGSNINPDDCYYYNCKVDSFACTLPAPFCSPPFWMGPPAYAAEWGYANSPVSECSGSPSGPSWVIAGFCHNPRLDIDNISTPGVPENINVDDPNDGQSFRVMVHYYGASASPTPVTHPLVNIYCGGHLLGTYGQAPDLVAGMDTASGFGAGKMWRVVDVLTHVSGGVTTGCDLTPIHPPGTLAGYYVTNNDRSY